MWANRACTILTSMDASIQSGQVQLNQDLSQATSLDQARSILQDSFTTTTRIFDKAINDLHTLGVASSPGGPQLRRGLIASLSEANKVNRQAGDRFEQADINSAADRELQLTDIQAFIGRQEFELDLHKTTADRTDETGDKALTTAVRANDVCRARDARESAIQQRLSQLYS